MNHTKSFSIQNQLRIAVVRFSIIYEGISYKTLIFYIATSSF